MSPLPEKHVAAIINSKTLRRASITSLFEPWANSEDLRLISFNFEQALKTLYANANLRMVIFSVGSVSIVEGENLQQLKVLRALATHVPLVVISDREDVQEIAAAFSAETKGFIHTGMDAELACEALSFILHGGSYFPPSAVRQFPQAEPEQADKPRGDSTDGSKPKSNNNDHTTNCNEAQDFGWQRVSLTSRQQQVLKQVRLGKSNKLIARRLGMMEATVKVHVRQMMRKFGVSNRTQLAVSPSLATSAAHNGVMAQRSVADNSGKSVVIESATDRKRTLHLIRSKGIAPH